MNKALSPDILVVSRTFLPKDGGIEEYVYNRCMQTPERIILLTASYPGDEEFDRSQPFEIYRWSIPKLLPSGKLGNVLKRIFSLLGSLILAIKLYFRYRYRYIEWGHGYDFLSLLVLTYLLPIQFFIYTYGNDILSPLKKPLLKSLFQAAINRTQGIVCISDFTRNLLKDHYCVEPPTYLIHPTVRPEKFNATGSLNSASDSAVSTRQKYHIPEAAILVLSVGRLVRRKGFDRVIKNLPQLTAEGLDIHYLICGRGDMEAELKSLSQALNVSDRVHFAGYVPDRELADYYKACDLFSMLTYFDTEGASVEGFGIVYVEAGYFCKPVLASRVGGAIDAVHHLETGILVDPDSATDLTQALRQLCADSQLRDRLGQTGREFANRKTPHSILYSSQTLT